jgi:hypothetical protein
MFKLTISAFAVASVIVSTASFAEVIPAFEAMQQLREDHPRLRTFDQGGRIHKLIDKELASGSSPINTAENFIETWSAGLGVDAKQFVARGPFQDAHSVQELMYNVETGQHKFTGIYYMQTADGLPVYGSRLMVLVRNVEGYPAVSSTTVLQNVLGFKQTSKFATNSAVALISAAIRLGKNVTITEPELMVFAGTETESYEPTEVFVYQATTGGHWDLENYRKLELVVNASTGEIIQETNLILHVDGNVSGMATESSGADVCDPESAASLPYAKVTLGGNTAYADVNGDFTIAGSGTITSMLDGQWFNVNNQSGSDASLSSADPYFMHNESNSSESVRAQVNGYLQSNVVRDFTLQYAPSFPTIGTQTSFPVNTGVSGTCNAFYDYSSINFYNAGGGCSNTAFSVIVHHEYGHHLVAVAGSGQGAYGEGMGDVMGVLITGDNQLARGFYSNDCVNGIRNAINTHQYPCSGEIHDCGQLISGCVWDALEAMEMSYPIQGLNIISNLAVNSIMLHTGTSISPSITLDWLVLDDNDGDLDTGTPHCAEIIAGFSMHNMGDSYECPNPALTISYPDGRPSLIDPNGGSIVNIDVAAGTEEPASGTLHWNSGLGWNSASLGVTYDATFPAFDCGDDIAWYISIETSIGNTVRSPSDAPISTWNAMAYTGSEVTFDDDFNTNQGWNVTNSAGTGNWERVTPSNGGARCDNPTDADGSGMCYVTGNGVDEDVDDGSTILTSPEMEFGEGAILSYSRWYSNGVDCGGADPNNDEFFVDVSYNGGAWTNLETVGPFDQSNGGWYDVEHMLSGAGTLQVRFVCGDLNSGSVIEAAVDAVAVKDPYCDDPACAGDTDGDGMVGVSDLLVVIDMWGQSGGAGDINDDGTVDVGDLLAVVDAWGPC